MKEEIHTWLRTFLETQVARNRITELKKESIINLKGKYISTFNAIKQCFDKNNQLEDFLENLILFEKVKSLRKELVKDNLLT